ncbi:MAG: hypothetical protein JO276_12390 [Sphingomonadaceae bacterium]|nr:hypothetical protein [Sphingomonadaceae bacterium]
MKSAPKLDGRRLRELDAELRRRATAVLSGDGSSPPLGPVTGAILAVAARIGEEVTRRLDQAPAKQSDNFYNAAGIGRDPARPAALPVAFALAEGAKAVTSAPGRTQLMADADGPVIFETETRIDLVPGTIAALRGFDADADSISIPSASVVPAALPPVPPIKRRLRSGAAAGATKLQLDPAAGLQPGALLQLGAGAAARQYLATEVEGDLVTIQPGLEAALAENDPAIEVDDYRPFEAVTRNHQWHAFYLGHSKLLDVPSAVTINVTGAALPAAAEWSWWGQLGDDDPPAWHRLVPNQDAALSFAKPAGKPAKKKIGTQESLWLRARLPGRSAASATAQDVRIAIGGRLCSAARDAICSDLIGELNTGFEAFANTTPVVTNSPFHPFGREPRLFDSFYIGSDEAFSKAGADVSLCFGFGGPDFGPLAAVADARGQQVFALGAGNMLYRADFRSDPPVLLSVPQPPGMAGAEPPQTPSLAAWSIGDKVWLAVGGRGSVRVAEMVFDDKLYAGSVKWVQLPLDARHRGLEVDRVAFSGTKQPLLFAKAGTALLRWDDLGGNKDPKLLGETCDDLLPIQGEKGALLSIEQGGRGKRVKRAGEDDFGRYAKVTGLPGAPRTAWLRSTSEWLYVAGYVDGAKGTAIKLVRIEPDGATKSFEVADFRARLPLLFEDSQPTNPYALPTLIAADTQPTRFIAKTDMTYAAVPERESIGTSARRDRSFLVGAGRTIVQRSDSGLLYRAVEGSGTTIYKVTFTPLVDVRGRPGGVLYATLGDKPPVGGGFTLDDSQSGWRTLRALPSQQGEASGSTALLYVEAQPRRGDAVWEKDAVQLYEDYWRNPSTPATIEGSAIDVMAYRDGGSSPTGIWRLTRNKTGAWTRPANFPGGVVSYVLLSALPTTAPVSQALTTIVPEADRAAFERLRSSFNPDVAPTVLRYDGERAYLVPRHDLLVEDKMPLSVAPQPWLLLGPGATANPTLSWEYWNGESWWALANRDLRDDTANFQKSGGVFFKAPADIRPTDVGGAIRYWIRARLVGGDYGEAKVMVTSVPGPNQTTEQVATRDVSTVRAPYVTGLKLGYCALNPVRPEIVLTEDSLGSVDRTSANEAGLAYAVFTPVAELMNPVSAAEASAEAAAISDSCEDPCPPPPSAPPSPCDAPGAYESCDSPCLPPPGYRPPSAAAAGTVRGLMLGFSRPVAGNNVSLYVDADPAGPPAELIAELLQGGRFVPASVVGDTSYGLTEAGILTLALPSPPDLSELFGIGAHWLRLRPKGDGSTWSPRLRGLHLNAVRASSTETREKEQLGQSIGIADQVFHLTEPPVAPGSLELRVRELLADEEKADPDVDVASYAEGPAGDWVLWRETGDLIDTGAPARVFVLDPQSGEIRFGNGATGLIPPLGAEIMAVRYGHVTGAKANGVSAGKILQTLSPLAGVEKVIALDDAAGGSDAEALERARGRAAAKVRHGGRILSRADLEDYAPTVSPGIAQVRAEKKNGGTRLVVVMAGPEARPTPAELRAYGDAIRAVSGYGLKRPGGLNVVAPRLLPLAITLVLQPASPDLFAEAAEQAKAALAALFDPATGNHDGKGWPLGRLPDDQDIAAALTPIAALALPERVTLERADKELAAERALPAAIPSDVLVRLDRIAFVRAQEAAA